MRRTALEIATAIMAIQWEYKELPHYSMFGDDNWATRDCQVNFLQRILDDDLEEWEIRDLQFELEEKGVEVGEDVEMLFYDLVEWVLGEDNDFNETIQDYLAALKAEE